MDADHVRDRYDASGRLVHELRVAKGRIAQAIALANAAEHAVGRTEIADGRIRIARNYWPADRLVVGECYEAGKRVGYVRYAYDDDGRVTEFDTRIFVAATPTNVDGAVNTGRVDA